MESKPQLWQQCKLEDIAYLHRDQVNPVDLGDILVHYYSIPAFDEDQVPKQESAKNIKSNKFLAPPDAVLLSKLNPQFPRVWLPQIDPTVKSLASTEFLVLRPRANIDRRFLKFLCSAQVFMNKLLERVTGTSSSHQRVRPDDVLTIEVDIPPLSEQHAIVAILGALDDKIELNHRMNKTLEAIAKALFKSWFVDFKPFHDQGVEESPLGLIPKGWQVGVLGDVVNRIESGSRPRGGVKEIVEGIPSIGAENILGLGKYDYSKTKLVPIDFFQNMQDGIVRRGDVLLYKDGVELGRKSYFDDGFPFDECCVNEHVFIIRTNDLVTQRYLYFWLDQPWMTEEIINLNSNSAQPGINRTSVATLTILIPSVQVVESFDKVVYPLTKHIFINAKESRTLATIRDTLLPKLLSGEIRVKDTEKFVEVKT